MVERGMAEQHFGGILLSSLQASINQSFRQFLQKLPLVHLIHRCGSSSAANFSRQIPQSLEGSGARPSSFEVTGARDIGPRGTARFSGVSVLPHVSKRTRMRENVADIDLIKPQRNMFSVRAVFEQHHYMIATVTIQEKVRRV